MDCRRATGLCCTSGARWDNAHGLPSRGLGDRHGGGAGRRRGGGRRSRCVSRRHQQACIGATSPRAISRSATSSAQARSRPAGQGRSRGREPVPRVARPRRLAGAKLKDANLNAVDAKWADLAGADLTDALLYEPICQRQSQGEPQGRRLGRAGSTRPTWRGPVFGADRAAARRGSQARVPICVR